MELFRCDKCGTEIDKTKVISGHVGRFHFHLCPKCVTRFSDWLRKKIQ